MLEQLNVRNYALIDNISVNFIDGLNILTGETGAGKSILIDALGLLLGNKKDSSLIRTGSKETEVSGTVSIGKNKEAIAWLKEHEIEMENGAILIRCILKKTGRSTIYIQSSPVTRSDLNLLTSFLFDMHGQHEHQSLLSLEKHRKVLDRFGGSESLALNLYNDFLQFKTLKKKYEKLQNAEREHLREMDLLSFAIKEIEQGHLSDEEEETLEKDRLILSQSEKLFRYLKDAIQNISEKREGTLYNLNLARSAMNGISAINQELLPLSKRLDDAFYEIDDVAETLKKYQSSVDFSPQRLEDCEQRLSEIHKLQKKYGDTIKDVLRYKEESSAKLETIENWKEDKLKYEKEISELEKIIFNTASDLSAKRKKAASELEKCIEDQLKILGMPMAVFKIEVKQQYAASGKPVCGQFGIDKIEFTISPNKGEPLKPLRSIASGGEISRIMLAIKSVLAETDDIQSLIFDEIDVGIGGEVALSVGEHLYKLSFSKQVLCITHLASIAVYADNHIKIEKGISDNRTVTKVKRINGEERAQEIARMLSGDSKGDTSLNHAKEMLEKCNSGRNY